MSEDERGFTLLEAAIAVLVFVTASAAAVGAWIAMAHSATTDPNRSLAISVAHNVLTRVHASAAYYARSAYPDAIGNPADAPNADSLDYALVSKPPAFNTTASIVTAGGNGNGTPKAQQITMSVTTSLAFTNVGLVDSVAVRYPVSASVPAITRTVTVSEIIAPPNYIPGTTLQHQIAEPMAQ